jgi:hypothetical protein
MNNKEAIDKNDKYFYYLSFSLVATGLLFLLTLLDFFVKYFNLYPWFFGLTIICSIISLILYKKLLNIKKNLKQSKPL